MSAPVRIEARAWGDIRFATLARLLGLADSDHALIKVARLWSWQTEHFDAARPTYVLDADMIESVLGPGGPAALVRAKLATEIAGGYRLHGTEGQIEWCEDLSSTRQHAGRARAAGARRDARGRLLPREYGDQDYKSPAHGPAPVQHPSSGSPAQSSAPSPSPSPEDQRSLPPARDPAVPAPAPTTLPPDPSVPAAPTAADRDVKPANAIPSAPTSREVEKPATAPAYDPDDPRARGRLAELTWQRVSDARLAIAAELKLPTPLPLGEITPAARPRGFDELSTRIREAGALAPEVCDRVVANLVKQARAKRSIDWLSERAFGDKAWPNARDGIDPSARSAAGRGDQRATQPSMPTPPKFAREVERRRAPEEIAELAAMARHAAAVTDGRSAADLPTAELVKRFGDGQRAPPASAGPDEFTDDERKPRSRKASTT